MGQCLQLGAHGQHGRMQSLLVGDLHTISGLPQDVTLRLQLLLKGSGHCRDGMVVGLCQEIGDLRAQPTQHIGDQLFPNGFLGLFELLSLTKLPQ